ncbi:MAG: class I SAM-dependent methyltransferase [Gemmatimonadota bacterium]|nr:class I SAM-dependent methyltransferase [Gemmatimonadota bacterium]
MGLYEKHVLPRLIHLACRQATIEEQRERVVPRARGRVLEIGIGSGLNLPHYVGPAVERVWGLDPSRPLLRRAADAAGDSTAPASVPTSFLQGRAEAIPLPGGSVDTVVMTWTLCSIDEPGAALREIRRILAPDGRLFFAEHGRAPEEGVRAWQRRLTPLWKRFSGGCHLDRAMPDLIREAGFELEEVDAHYLDGAPRFAGYNYRGVAAPG